MCLQLSFIATCCIQGSKQERIFTVDVGNVSAVDTLNFTFSTSKVTSDEIGMTGSAHKACGHIIWLGDLKNMWQGTVLRCDKGKSGPSGEFFNITIVAPPVVARFAEMSILLIVQAAVVTKVSEIKVLVCTLEAFNFVYPVPKAELFNLAQLYS